MRFYLAVGSFNLFLFTTIKPSCTWTCEEKVLKASKRVCISGLVAYCSVVWLLLHHVERDDEQKSAWLILTSFSYLDGTLKRLCWSDPKIQCHTSKKAKRGGPATYESVKYRVFQNIFIQNSCITFLLGFSRWVKTWVNIAKGWLAASDWVLWIV